MKTLKISHTSVAKEVSILDRLDSEVITKEDHKDFDKMVLTMFVGASAVVALILSVVL